MSGKQMKRLRRALRAAGAGTTDNEHFIVGRKKTVPLTEEMRNNAIANISRIKDFNQRTEALKKLPAVGTQVELVLDKHIVCDDKRRMYKEYKKVLREKNKGGARGQETVINDIERNQRSNPMGAVSPDGERGGVPGDNEGAGQERSA